MNADLLTILEYWEREKGISRDILLNAVEEALISAAKNKNVPDFWRLDKFVSRFSPFNVSI